VTQVTTVGQVQSHQAVMRLHESLVDLQVGGTTAQTLNIDAPFLRVQVEGTESASLAGQLDSVNVLVTSVVAGTGVTLGVLVGHGRAQGIVDSAGGDILRGNENDGLSLTLDLFFLKSEPTISDMSHWLFFHILFIIQSVKKANNYVP
jgi:hypothetical protein